MIKKILFKIVLAGFVLGLLALIPLNSKLTFGYGTTGTPSCGREKPPQVVLYEPNHPLLPRATGQGEVRLNWLKVERANKYTVGFGLLPSNYIYGAVNIPDTNNYTITHLNPGTRYYFSVKGVNDCMPGDWSKEWSVVVGRSGGFSGFTYTRSTGSNVSPSPVLRREGTGNEVVPTAVPTTVQPTGAPENGFQPTPTPTPRPGFFQRVLNFIFGKR